MLTTSDAADLVGVRYETIRNWLKKGLLEDTGPTSDRKWRSYSSSDLCRLQLVKSGLETGVLLDTLVDASNDSELVSIFDALSDDQYTAARTCLLIWSALPEAQYMLTAERAVLQELARNRAPVTLIDLNHIHQIVAELLATIKRAA